MRTVALAALLILVGLSGCLSDDTPDGTPQAQDPLAPSIVRPVVVAVIDSGVNVYHDHYQRNESLSDVVLATFVGEDANQTPVRISLTQDGTYDERLEADKAVWDNMSAETLYYFEGTHVLGISFDADDPHPVLDDGSHGTGTTGAVLDAFPGAVIVLVEGDSNAGEAWAAGQPWIDIVSMSYGPPGSPPKGGMVFELETSKNTKVMWENGKVPVGAADNSPALATVDETAGPPWVVGVAGDRGNCRTLTSGTFADFTSTFTQELPRSKTVDEKGAMSGTSFATPKTAGSFAAALSELRARYGAPPAASSGGVLAYGPDNTTITNVELRAAFERAATYLPADPDCAYEAVNPVAPWVQQGWGHVGPEIASHAVAVITGDHPVDEKPKDARDWNARQMMLRETYWNT